MQPKRVAAAGTVVLAIALGVETLPAQDGGARFGGRFAGRNNLVARGGGSAATESAVEAGLRWLARHQSPDGSWSATGFEKQCRGAPCGGAGVGAFDVGLTGLSLLAFLGAGHTPQDRATYVDAVTGNTACFGDVVRKGLSFLIQNQGADGSVGPQTGQAMYNDALATLALCEAYGTTNDAALLGPAQKAASFIGSAQNDKLGWRYTARCNSNDTSCTGWCLLALKTAVMCGLGSSVDSAGFEGARTWIDRVTDANGQVGYDRLGSGEIFVPGKNERWAHHPTMTAIGAFSRLLLGTKPKDAVLAKGAHLLAQDLPRWDPAAARVPNDFYYWYQTTLALFQLDGPEGARWKTWNDALTSALLPNQRVRKDGCLDGSWDTVGVDRWAYAGGRVYGTAINVLTLEVYYRYPRLDPATITALAQQPAPAPAPAGAPAPAVAPSPGAVGPSPLPAAPAPTAKLPAQTGGTFVLVVGINDYKDSKIPKLKFAEADAQAVYSFFATEDRSPTAGDRVTVLLGAEASRVAVLKAIREQLVLKARRPEDTAVLYFAGHGFADAKETYLAGADTELALLRDTGISGASLRALWSEIPAGRKVLLVDACHSAGIEGLRGIGGVALAPATPGGNAPAPAGAAASVTIAASGANEFSVEDRKLGHGVFTTALLNGLRGGADADGDGRVTAQELGRYLVKHVPELAARAEGQQTPVVDGDGEAIFLTR